MKQKKGKTQCLHLNNHHHTFSTSTFINIAHKISLHGYITQFIHNLLTIIVANLLEDFVVTHNFFFKLIKRDNHEHGVNLSMIYILAY
jgi:hypothetical protein